MPRGDELPRSISYIPYGEIFVEESDNKWVPPYRFNAKELGARYLDPTSVGWLSVDPMWEKNIGASPYNYCHGNPVVLTDPDGKLEIAYTNEDLNYYDLSQEEIIRFESIIKNIEKIVDKDALSIMDLVLLLLMIQINN
ncbi:MAG: hypothetical protein MJZ37_11110 [Bacilli bacterium]|nr:hypothetical protein [Bacilli bacterium]